MGGALITDLVPSVLDHFLSTVPQSTTEVQIQYHTPACGRLTADGVCFLKKYIIRNLRQTYFELKLLFK